MIQNFSTGCCFEVTDDEDKSRICVWILMLTMYLEVSYQSLLSFWQWGATLQSDKILLIRFSEYSLDVI